ncbi:MAG: hypothetical protein P1V36_00040 [Planctomycetota bacterium]|nr:hypothetical protein [Planctomycetota bacterium]
MALTRTPTDDQFTDVLVNSTDVVSSPDEDVFDGPKTICSMTLDNSQNVAVSYAKLYDAVTADPSADVPDYKFKLAASTAYEIVICDGLPMVNGLTMRCVTDSGDTGTTDPSSNAAISVIGS